MLAYSAPVVSRRVREYVPGRVDGGGRDRRLEELGGPQLRARVFVPVAVPTVAAGGRERLVLRVEDDTVNSEDVLCALRRVRSMALEREVLLRVRGLQVLDAHSTLDAPDRKTCTQTEITTLQHSRQVHIKDELDVVDMMEDKTTRQCELDGRS